MAPILERDASIRSRNRDAGRELGRAVPKWMRRPRSPRGRF